jgi:hypothetical protein
MGLILSKSIRSDMPVKGSHGDSISFYSSANPVWKRFMILDHEVMKRGFGEGFWKSSI